MHQALITFLFAYRRTPHITTRTTPAKLFVGRELRSRLDLLQPEERNKVDKRQSTETYRKMERGDKVLARFYGNDKKWKFGVISRKLGSLHYLVTVDGLTHKRHIDQLRKV